MLRQNLYQKKEEQEEDLDNDELSFIFKRAQHLWVKEETFFQELQTLHRNRRHKGEIIKGTYHLL